MKNQKPITKAVIAAAGYGTRFLPATKNLPKEILPIIDRPVIEYLVKEAIAAGIKTIILVGRGGKSILKDYFNPNRKLENFLKKNKKIEALKIVKQVPYLASFVYQEQKPKPYGNAAPLLMIKDLIDQDEAFIYIFGDDLIKSKIPATQQLIKFYHQYQPAAVLAVQSIPLQEIKHYGAVQLKKGTTSHQVEKIWEKVSAKQAPSNLAMVGRFVLTYQIIEEAIKTPLAGPKELNIVDVFNRLAKKEKIIACPFVGKWLTVGDPFNYLQAAIEFALDNPKIGPRLKNYLKNLSL